MKHKEMKSLYIVFANNSNLVDNPTKDGYEFDTWSGDYDRYDKILSFYLNKEENEPIWKAYMKSNSGKLAQFYVEKWRFKEDWSIEHISIERIGYGTVKDLEFGKLSVVDFKIENKDEVFNIKDIYKED